MSDPLDLAGVLPSGKIYKGSVSRDRIDLRIDGVHYWVWVNARGVTAGWSINYDSKTT